MNNINIGNIGYWLSFLPYWVRVLVVVLASAGIWVWVRWPRFQWWRLERQLGTVRRGYQKKPRLSEIQRRRHG